mgnify:CR=1 FL=1
MDYLPISTSLLAENGLCLPVEDDFLVKYLRPFKCNAEQAFKMLRKFYKFKVKYPKYGGVHVTPDGVRHVFDSEVFMFLPTRSLTGGRIMIINAGGELNRNTIFLKQILNVSKSRTSWGAFSKAVKPSEFTKQLLVFIFVFKKVFNLEIVLDAAISSIERSFLKWSEEIN